MATKHKGRAKRNPAAAAEKTPFPFLDADYPVKPWVSPTGERFQTISVQQDDGTFVATIAERPEHRFTAKTRRAAEQGLLKLFSQARRNPRTEADEDEEDLRVAMEREKDGRLIPLREFLRQYGR